MATITVTISPADVDPEGDVPRVGFVTFARLAVDHDGDIRPVDPASVRVTAGTQSITLEAGKTYKVRGDGLPGFGTFYALATTGCTLAQFRDDHQVDPTTLQPVNPVSTVGEQLTELGQAIPAAQAAAIAAAQVDATARAAAAQLAAETAAAADATTKVNALATSVAATYVGKPGSGDATGSVPTKQADGSIAYVVPTGGGGGGGAVSSVAGKTGAVTLVKSDVGLANVDNTADSAKPVSTAQQAALAGKADLVGGVVPTAQIPAIAITEFLGSVASQAAMLALTGQKGDWAIRTDLGTTWTITGDDPTQLASWTALSYPTAPVTTVAGRTGAVTLTKTDVGLDQVDNTSDANKPVSTAQQTALNAKATTATIADPAWQQTASDGASTASPWQHFTQRSQRPPSKVVARFNGASGWTGGTEDLTTTLFGDRTYKVTHTAAGGIFANSPVFTAQDWSTSIIRAWVKVDNPAAISAVNMYLIQGSGNIVSCPLPNNLQANEWTPLTVARAAMSVNGGTPNWAGVTQIQMQSVGSGTGTGTVWYGGFELIPDLGTTYPSGVMICEFDDGYAGQFTNGLPVLASRGIPATFNVINERFIGSPSASGKYAADLRNLQDVYGWEISCHAHAASSHASGVNNGLNTTAVMEADFQRQKQWLHANGLHTGADHYALCPGTGSPVAQGAMFDALRKSFRSVRVNSGFYETASPADPLRLRSVLFSGAGNNVANLKVNIDKSAGAGGALILAMHDVITGSTDGTSNGLAAIAANNLATVLDYAISKGMVFRTRADYIDGR